MSKGFLLCFLFLAIICNGQESDPVIDSLVGRLYNEDNDSLRADLCLQLGHNYHDVDNGEALKYADLALSVGQSEKLSTIQGRAHRLKGSIYHSTAEYELALENFLAAAKIFETYGPEGELGDSYLSIGSLYYSLILYDKSIDFYNKALEIYRKTNDKASQAIVLNNIGTCHIQLGDFKNATRFMNEALKLYEELNDDNGIASIWINLGNIYSKQDQLDEAKSNYMKALKIFTEMGDDMYAELVCHLNIANLLNKQGKEQEAINYLQKCEELSQKLGDKNLLSMTYLMYSESYAGKKDYKTSNEYLIKYTDLKDTLYNDGLVEQLAEMSQKYESEKKQREIELLEEKNKNSEQKNKIQELENRQQKQDLERSGYAIVFSCSGLILLLVLALLLINRNNIRKRANLLLTQQKEEILEKSIIIEQKNKDITDSIVYAKRIQAAILPSARLVKECLADSFILYKPKDIVAGDFYWMEKKEDTILFAAADCTGHGVPGAMVSVICNNGLNRSVREHNLIDPGKILDKTREIVIQEFDKSDDNDVKDGMDISLCTLSPVQKNGSAQSPATLVSWAGANNPIWIIRKGLQEVYEIKPDKQPIGKYADAKSFTSHKIELNKGDSFYILTDGFQDQFGGEKGKKFKSSNLKALLLSIQNEAMEMQKELLDKAFENWKGPLEQVDDVCVIGIRI